MNFSSVLRGPRALGREARAGLSGEEPAYARVAVGVYSALVVAAGALSWGLGLLVYRVQSTRVATLITVAAAIFCVLGSAPLVTEVLRILRKRSKPKDASAEEAAPSTAAAPTFSLRTRIVCAVVFAAIEDGLVAASTTLRAHVPFLSSVGAGLEATCLVVLPLALLLIPVGFVLSRPGAGVLGRHLRAGLGGEEPEAEGVAVVLYATLLALGANLSWRVGLRVGEFRPAEQAILVSAATTIACTLGASLVVAAVATPAASLVRLTKRVVAIPSWLPLEELALAVLGVIVLYALLPDTHAITPAAAVVGFAIGPAIASRLTPLESLARFPVLALVGVALLFTLTSTLLFDRLPDPVRTGVVGRAPYAALFIGAIHHPVDRERRDHPATPYKPPPQVAARDPNAPAMRDNVIMIHIEALRPDHVGFIGYKRPTTPRIDRFREHATWFKNAYSPAPTTRFALSMLFTGWDIERIPQARGHAVDYTLLPGATTLAERLQPLGYDRVGYTLSYVIQHIHDLGQGFRIWETPWQVNDWEKAYQNSAEQTTNAALKYLSTVPADGSKPYFLFLHYMSNHDPYIKHPKWDYGDTDEDKYDSALNYEDDQLGRLFDALDTRADKDKTAIFLYSDHGELFGEHGYHRHGFTLYQPDIHVLLLASVPGTHVATVDTPMLLTDITPTIAELTGLPPDKESEPWDLLPYMRGAPMPPRQLFLYSDQWRTGVHYVSRGVIDVDGRTKLIHNISVRSQELYDILDDPQELTNLADARPKDVERLSDEVDGWEDYENPQHKSYETSNKEVKEKQAKMPLPVYPGMTH
ncbi:MAG: sulfatase [Polyangiaceae bacterium]